jgi:sigma-B regulation protein RsbU (phosphoserine phosphatase)
MNNPFPFSYFVVGVSILNLLMVVGGLLLVYFDWSAARRRELLYLVFTEEKPGQNYFSSARRRRALYTRLLLAFILLTLHHFLETNLFAVISEPNMYGSYLDWWRTRGATMPGDALQSGALLQAMRVQIWWNLSEIMALILLGAGWLYDLRAQQRSALDTLSGVLVALWAVIVAVIMARIYGFWGGDQVIFNPLSPGVSINEAGRTMGNNLKSLMPVAMLATRITDAMRAILILGVVVSMMRRSQAEREESSFPASTLSMAFILWLAGSIVSHLPARGESLIGSFFGNPAALILGQSLSLVLFVMLIARHVLAEYEVMERSRHRLGRERQVIIQFLQRIGAAFSTAPELETVLDLILSSALETTEAHAAAIYLYNPETKRLGPPVMRHFFPPLYTDTSVAYAEHQSGATEVLQEQSLQQTFALGEGVIGEVAQSGQARLVPDVRAEGIVQGRTTQYFRDYSMMVAPLRVRDEPQAVIAVLQKQRGSFNTEDQSLLQALADQGALVINHVRLITEVREQERLQRELKIAHDIQQRLLPERCPTIPGFEIGAYGAAATEVGGDYYDFFEVDPDHLGIVVADVSGKGVHAALVVAMMRSAFRMQARHNLDVRDVLQNVNEFIGNDLPQEMFITCIYGILEVSTRRFTWARAGHEPLILAHPDDSTDVIAPAGFALGVLGSPDFDQLLEVDTVTLQSGDRILLFTDGLTEAMNASGEEFGMQRILGVMSHENASRIGLVGKPPSTKTANTHPVAVSAGQTAVLADDKLHLTDISPCGPGIAPDEPEDLLSMERAVEDHVAGAPQSDDLTMVFLAAK